MHRKSLNIAAVCVVALMVSFAFSHTKKEDKNPVANISVEGEVGEGGNENKVLGNQEEYQQQVMQALLDQNLKAFENTSASFKKSPTDTMSETIAKNVFTEYISYNTSESLDIDKIQSETIAAVQNNPAPRSNLGMQDIKLSGDRVADVRNYVNSISIIQKTLMNSIYKIKGEKNENQYVKALYAAAADLYIKQPVPSGLSQEHINIINGYKDFSASFDLLELQDTDPARALSGVQLAKEAQDSLIASFESIRKVVSLNKIEYGPEDAAYAWFSNASSSNPVNAN